MASWTHARRVRETINAANHASGWKAQSHILGGVDDEGLPLLTSADLLITVWSKEHNVLHLLAACECMDAVRCN